jgi:hypothetical protein
MPGVSLAENKTYFVEILKGEEIVEVLDIVHSSF